MKSTNTSFTMAASTSRWPAWRDARAIGHDQRHVQDLRRDRLAGRHDHRAAAADARVPPGARLRLDRRGRPVARGRRRRLPVSSRVLRPARRRLPGPARSVLQGPLGGRLRLRSRPQGAYYIMAGIAAFGATDDVDFARYLVRDIGVATVPGSSFFQDKALGVRMSASASANGIRPSTRPPSDCGSAASSSDLPRSD